MADRAQERTGGVSNDFSGSAGNVLQVGSLSGDVHVHSTVPVMAQPRQLPSTPDGFTGRDDHVAELDALLRAEGPESRPTAVVISAIGGTAGIGKTSLALFWAHRVADHFPDGQLYVNLRGFDPGSAPVRPVEALRGFLDALRIPATSIPDEQSYPMVPPNLFPREPEPPVLLRTQHRWHLNGDGSLCLLRVPELWTGREPVTDLLLKAAGWRIEYELMKANLIDRMSENGIVTDPTYDHLVEEAPCQDSASS
jgi:hypothetical protein